MKAGNARWPMTIITHDFMNDRDRSSSSESLGAGRDGRPGSTIIVESWVRSAYKVSSLSLFRS